MALSRLQWELGGWVMFTEGTMQVPCVMAAVLSHVGSPRSTLGFHLVALLQDTDTDHFRQTEAELLTDEEHLSV